MELGEIVLSARIGAPLKKALRLGALAALALGFAPGRAAAQSTNITTCQSNPITTSVTLGGDLVATATDTSPCISVGADGLTVNLAGHKLDISALGDGAVAIETGTSSNTTIVGNGGTIITDYTSSGSAIDSTGGTNLTVTGPMSIFNETTPGQLCAYQDGDKYYGTGISFNGVTGGSIGMITVSCYQNGISVQNSNIPTNGSGSISGNTLTYNTYSMYGGTSEVYSAGLVLSNSSGWSVSGNNIYYDGSRSPNGICTSPSSTTGVNTCAFGLQIINGSSSNSLTGNTVDSNFSGGIYTGPDTTGNSIISNIAQTNGQWDLWDDAPAHHANTWHRNTCGTAGGTLNPHSCHN